MIIGDRHHRSIWYDAALERPRIIDQTALPHHFETVTLADLDAACHAIRVMQVRGAPLIGATAAHGIALAMRADPSDAGLQSAGDALMATRPTAVNLRWAIDRMQNALSALPEAERAAHALSEAVSVCEEDVETCEAIGTHGLGVLAEIARSRGRGNPGAPLRVLTHCNAGWLATVDWGTALAPIYKAGEAGHAIHVWVDETRPRNQGSSLTAFELREQGIDHAVIVDNAGGHLMQRGEVDVVIVGSDRTTGTGDVCNKIGTYLKALAAHDNGVPFYVALPTSSIDWSLDDGLTQIPIEERDASEVRQLSGRTPSGDVATVELFSEESAVSNPAFDVTPAALVSGLITEHGLFEANGASLSKLASIVDQAS